jgi:hypothetical protein
MFSRAVLSNRLAARKFQVLNKNKKMEHLQAHFLK